MSADYRKSYLWAKKYLLKIANFSILIVLLKFSFFFDITAFTAYGIRMKSGAHIIKEKFSALCIHCGKNYYFSFYSISFIYDICIWRNCLQPYLVHFYNAFLYTILLAFFNWYQLSYMCYSFLQYDLPSPSSPGWA